MNFGLWAVAVAPAWLVVRQFGVEVESSPEAVVFATETDRSDIKGVATSEGLPSMAGSD
jgi:hypothetical protein